MLTDFLTTFIKNIFALAFMFITVYTNYSCTYFYVYNHHLCLHIHFLWIKSSWEFTKLYYMNAELVKLL